MGKREAFSFEALQDAEAVATYLGALADGVREGRVVLRSDGRTLQLGPRGLLRFRIEGKRGKHQSRLVLQVAWREDSGAEEPRPNDLTIDAGKT